MSIDVAAAIAANRFGLGARPGDLTAIAEDPQGWLRAQLPGGAPLMETAGLQSTQQILSGAEPIVREKFDKTGNFAVSSSPEEFDAFIHKEAARWQKVLKEANIKYD